MKTRDKALFALSVVAVSVAAVASETITYRYDARGRLVKTEHSGSVNNNVNTAFALDQADNRYHVWTGTGTPPSPPSPPGPAFAIGDASVIEGGTMSFTVNRFNSVNATITINYATAAGTAVSGTDYTSASGTLSFAAGEYSKTVSVATAGDSSDESDETLVVNLSSPSGGATISDAQGAGLIQDDDDSNAPPVTSSDTGAIADVCSTGSVGVNVVTNDSDPEGGALTVTGIQSVSPFGTASFNATSVTFFAQGQTGSATITYIVKDSQGARATGALGVTVGGTTPCP